MKIIVIFITACMLFCNTLIAQTQETKVKEKTVTRDSTKKVKRDSSKKEIIIKDNWSNTKKVNDDKTTNKVLQEVPVGGYLNSPKSPSELFMKSQRDFENQSQRFQKSGRKVNRRFRQTNIGVGNTRFSVKESTDTTVISLGGNELVLLDKGFGSTVKVRQKKHSKRFRGHWTGFELGIASFMKNNDEESNGFMELKYPKSSMVNINFLQANIKLIGPKFGLVTGLGLSWYNFTFKDDFTVVDGKDADGKPCTTQKAIKEVYPKMGSVKKTKLTMSYLTLPLLLEVQGNRRNTYLSVGVIAGVKLDAHTKIKFSSDEKEKEFEDFYLLPYKLDATVRVGHGCLTVWASYNLTKLFQKDKLYDNVNNKYINKTPIALGLSFNIF